MNRKNLLILGIILTLAMPVVLTAETVSFPARASDLPIGWFWNMSGDHGGSNARDLDVVRPNGSGWTDLDADGGPENSDRLIFGVPLYAPVDGEVVSCWRNHPENPRPGTPHPGRCCGNNCDISCDDSGDCPSSNACTIARSGNHVAIRKADGDVVLLAHLKRGSVPASVCPNSATFMSNARDRLGDFPAESYLRLCGSGESPQADDCVTSRPKVKRGELVGMAGNSGASGKPHLHIHQAKVKDENGVLVKEGLVRPTNINYGWLKHRTDASIWKPFLADAIRNPPVLVQASPYLRRADASAGAVRQTDTLFLSGNRAVIATIADSNRKLKLITWDLVGLETINRRGDVQAGAAKEVRLGEALGGFVLAAVRQADDVLTMIAYQVTPTGGLLRRSSRVAGKISALDMATTRGVNRRSITAVRDVDGNLKLIAWDVQLANNGSVSIVRLGEATAGAVSALSVTRAKNFSGVFTAVRDGEGKLKVIPWRLSSDGGTFTRRTDAAAGAIDNLVDVAPLGKGVAAAVKDADGSLRLITWSVSSSGDIGQRRQTGFGGSIDALRLLTSPNGGSNLTAVVRGAVGELRLIGWRVDDDGRKLRRLGSSKAGSASRISADVVSRSFSLQAGGTRDTILTALRDSGGDLKLISWDTNLVNP